MAGLAAASCSDDKPSYMNLSDKEMSVSSDGGTLTMTVTANVHYVVNHDNDWFSIVSTSNEGDATVVNRLVAVLLLLAYGVGTVPCQ